MNALSIFLSILGGFGTVFGIVSFAVTNRRNNKRDDRSDGQTTGAICTELGYIKANTDEIKAEQKEQRKVNTEVVSRLTAVEASAKQAHHRIDTLVNRTQ